jgi:hypothetical protein
MASTATRRIILEISIPEEENNTLLRNFDARLPSYAASYLRMAESLGTPLERPQNSYILTF